MVVDVEVVLTLWGFWAPQGWLVRQAYWQPLFPPQLLTHSLFASVQMKYGMVCEYSDALGVAPLLQTQLNTRVSGSQEFSSGCSEFPGV